MNDYPRLSEIRAAGLGLTEALAFLESDGQFA
jgi:hypothetical protein